MTTKHFLTWDLGGTKCAAGLIEHNDEKNTYVCLKQTSVLLAETNSLIDLIKRIENDLKLSMSDTDAICIGAAGQYDGQSLVLENGYPYDMPFAKLAHELKWPHYAIIHDYATVLCGTFTQYLYSTDFVKRLNNENIPIFERRLTFGIGTSLGGKDGLLLENGHFWLGTNEIGFIGLPALIHEAQYPHSTFLHYLRSQNTHSCLTFETTLSGPGLQLLYRFLYPERPALSAQEIGLLMQQGEIKELADLFAWYLGLFVATMQLSFMPGGGIWMTGGVLLKHIELVKKESFYDGINALPAYIKLRNNYPLGILHHPDWALIGAAFYANKRLQPETPEQSKLYFLNKNVKEQIAKV